MNIAPAAAIEDTPRERKRQPLWLRFWSKVEIDPVTNCWLWRGGIGKRRRGGLVGRLRKGGRADGFVSPHRQVTKWAHGEPPREDAEAGHTCFETLCCNPAHLRWVTRCENEQEKEFEAT